MLTSANSESSVLATSVPGAAPIGQLTEIWRRVLDRPAIGPEDNFFAVGGTVESADLLFAEITQAFGRELPSATIYQAPTIATLLRVLEQPTLPRFSPFVQLKSGRDQTPIHIVHGLAGLPRFSELAEQIKTNHPIYGIQAKGIDGLEEPLDGVEDMANRYLDALGEVQARGPYFLIGYSFGGLVALEMAQRLIDRGETIGLLAFIDAYPDPQYLSKYQRSRLTVQRAIRYVTEFDREHPVIKAFLGFAHRTERRLFGTGYTPSQHQLNPPRLSFASTVLRVKERAYVALARYRPRAYSGKIKFVKSGHDTYYPSNPAAVWTDLSHGVEVAAVPGGHLDMVTTNLAGLAAVLTRYIQEATNGK